MSHSQFPVGNRVQTIDAMIDYIIFMQNIAVHEGLPEVVANLGAVVEDLREERKIRFEEQQIELPKSA